MDDDLKHVIEDAVKEEEYFQKLYANCAKKTSSEAVRKVMIALSNEEMGHKKKLMGLDFQKICTASQKKIDIGERIMLAPITEFKELKETFEFAIDKEKQSRDKYLALSGKVRDKDAKALFKCLADEEKHHELLLKVELKNIGI